MLEEKVSQYIELIVVEGVRIQQDDAVHISADVASAHFVQQLVERLYEKGAAIVHVRYSDEVNNRMSGLAAREADFTEFACSDALFYQEMLAKKSKRISINSPHPDGMSGVSSEKLMQLRRSTEEGMSDYKKALMGDEVNWTIAAIPNAAWAQKVFPELEEAAAISALWEAIFTAVHLYDGADSCLNWQQHLSKLHQRVETLNGLNLTKLHYRNSQGTDLHVGLPKGHVWAGGGASNVQTKQWFSPNLPTEEVFTLPHAYDVHGIVKSSKPLLFEGQLIEDFTLEFVDGAVVSANAAKGEELLRQLVATDEGSCRLGEVALVPYQSPISAMDVLFYMTLFDENASCHFALGAAYANTLPASISMNEAECKEAGFNTSLMHVDFMIGTADLSITGLSEANEAVSIFEDGNFVI